MVKIKDGNQIAQENGMQFDYPQFPHELNAHTFRTGKMDKNCRWIDHTFYFAKDMRDVIRRKIAAERTPYKLLEVEQ